MAADIVFEQGDSIKLEAARVGVTGRVNLPRVQGAEPVGGGEYGDLVITVEETHNPVLNIDTTTTPRLWLCVHRGASLRPNPDRPTGARCSSAPKWSPASPMDTWYYDFQLSRVHPIELRARSGATRT